MSMSDPIADLLTRIRNADGGQTHSVNALLKVKVAIARYWDEGYIRRFPVICPRNPKPNLSEIALKCTTPGVL